MLSLRCDSGSELAAPMILAAGAFRHFGASLLEQANVPIGSIQRILGHEHRSTTELYLHSIGESEREAMDVLNDRFESFSHTDSHTKKKGDKTESS